VTSSSGDDGGISSGYDSGNHEDSSTGGGDDSGQQAMDSGTGQDAAADGPSCTAIDTGNPNCNQCLAANCIATVCPCTSDTSVDDAGLPQCINDVQCIADCVAGNPDAGVAPGTQSQCEMDCGGSYTMTENQNAAALYSCISQSCMSQCLSGL
jgi:hypothetical protein